MYRFIINKEIKYNSLSNMIKLNNTNNLIILIRNKNIKLFY